MEPKKRHRSAPARTSEFRRPEPLHRSRLPSRSSSSRFPIVYIDGSEDEFAPVVAEPISFESLYISPTRVRASLSRVNLLPQSDISSTSRYTSETTPRRNMHSGNSATSTSSRLSTPLSKPKSPNGSFSSFADISHFVERNREKQLQSPLVSRQKPDYPSYASKTASSSNGSSSIPSTPSNLKAAANGNGISSHLPNPVRSSEISSNGKVDYFALPERRPTYVSQEEYARNAELLKHAEENATILRKKAKEVKESARRAWDDYRTPPLTAPRVPVPWPCSSSEWNDMDDRIRYGNAEETLVCQSMPGEQVTRHDLAHLLDSEWLNDTCINAYLHLLRLRAKESMEKGGDLPRVWVFGSFFLTKLCGGVNGYDYAGVRRITSRNKVDVFSLDKILVPFNLGNHWTMACINMQLKRFEYYDSLGGMSKSCIDALRRWLSDEWKDKKDASVPFDTSSWGTFVPKNIPLQRNGYDCGVFAILFGDYLAQGKPFDFTQEDMPALRATVIHRILQNEPLPVKA